MKLELDSNYERRVREEREVKSLIGHVKLHNAKNDQTSFAACTFAYLETHDLVKLLQLNREFRSELLSQNATVYVSHVYCGRIGQLATRIDEWSTRSAEQNRQISLFEAKDKARNSLLQNVNDQRLR